jgi:hypothetical protein
VISVILFYAVSSALGGGRAEEEVLTTASKKMLHRAVGNADPALPHRLAAQIGPRQLTTAFYKGTRAERLIALDAALETQDDPFFVAPRLAALMGARDRQTASRAAHALDTIMRRVTAEPAGYADVVPGQISLLMSQLIHLARDPRLDLDIRVIAMFSVVTLEPIAGEYDENWLFPLLRDSDTAVRRQAIGYLTPPLRDNEVVRLAEMVTDDADLYVRGLAASMLCENALAHNVKDPSSDLNDYLKTTLQTPNMPIAAIGSIIACLSRFEGEKKTSLIEIAIAHPDPAVKAYWTALSKKK